MNLASVNFIHSTGVGVLVGSGIGPGHPGLHGPGRAVRQARGILETTGLTKVFPVYGTEAEAVQACREPATEQT